LTNLGVGDPDYGYFDLSFGKRPAEELYDILSDPHCVNNLAESAEYKAIAGRLWNQLRKELTAQGDPRMLGQGDIFDRYPNSRVEKQGELYDDPDYDPVRDFEVWRESAGDSR